MCITKKSCHWIQFTNSMTCTCPVTWPSIAHIQLLGSEINISAVSHTPHQLWSGHQCFFITIGPRYKRPNKQKPWWNTFNIQRFSRQGLAQSSGSLCVEESLPEPGRERESPWKVAIKMWVRGGERFQSRLQDPNYKICHPLISLSVPSQLQFTLFKYLPTPIAIS